MRVGVVGHSGMLGEEVVTALREGGYSPILVPRLDTRRCVSKEFKQRFSIAVDRCDVVINCVGSIPHRHDTPTAMLLTNGVFPHVLSGCFGGRILHVSTDCVFDSTKQHLLTVLDHPNPMTLYGRSKLSGEVCGNNITNIRTSFIGFRHGFLRWLVNNRGRRVEGWENAWWSGSTAHVVAKAIVDLLCEPSQPIEHVAIHQPTTKYQAACFLNELLGLNITIVPSSLPVICRSLFPTVDIAPIEEDCEWLTAKYQSLFQ